MRTTGTHFRRAGGVGIDALMHSKSQGPRRTLPGPSTFGCWPFSDQAKVRVESGRGKAQADAGRQVQHCASTLTFSQQVVHESRRDG